MTIGLRSACLNFHAPYRCAHAGACCTAGWPIAMDRDSLTALRTAHTTRALPWVGRLPDAAGESLTLSTTDGGACVLYDDGRCAIHRDAGPRLMPTPCRNFPRVTLRDRRGLFITLSHVCPTAARLLLTAEDLAIVDAPSSLSLGGQVEGLDATNVMPPLLRAGMLMDLEGYSEWERQAISVLAQRAYSPVAAIAVIRAATADVLQWTPGSESLTARTRRAFDRARVPWPRAGGPLEHATKAFLAAHVFASWAAYQEGGLAAVVDAVERALTLFGAVPDGEAAFIARVRAVDLQLRHRV
jgi:hypothetical protein